MLELDEFSREETFRLKRIKEKKSRTSEKVIHEDPEEACPICLQKIGGKHKKEEPEMFEIQTKPSLRQLKHMPSYIEKVHSAERGLDKPLVKGDVESTTRVSSRRALDPFNLLTMGESTADLNLESLVTKLGELISLGKSSLEKYLENIDIKDLLTACEDAKKNIETVNKTEEFKSEARKEQPDDNIKGKLEHLKAHLHEVTNVINEFKDVAILSPSVENFVRKCEEIDEKLNVYMKKREQKADTEETRSRLDELKIQIDDVVKVIKQYQKDELLSPSVEEFLKSCNVIKSKIDARIQESIAQDKLQHLKDHVKDIESITTAVKSRGLASESLKDFLKSCKLFKSKLVNRKDKDKTPPTEGGLEKLVSHIDETIELSKKARASGLVSSSVEDFIKSCEDVKSRITSAQKPETEKRGNVLDELECNIDDMMKLISKLKKEGLITQSMEEFIKSCEKTKSQVDLYKRFPDNIDGIMLFPPCNDSCICDTNDSEQDICDRCDEIFKDTKDPSDVGPPPCNKCAGLPAEDKSDNLVCESCDKPPQEEPSPAFITPEESSEICDVCRRYFEEDEKEEEKEQLKNGVNESEPPSSVDSTLGYFEKKIRKITRITRTQNSDGTVREEKEIITVKKERHDPNESTFDDDDDDFGDVSFESLIEEDDKKVGMCIVPSEGQRGFLLFKSRSEIILRVSSLTAPSLRQCTSSDVFGKMNAIYINNENILCST